MRKPIATSDALSLYRHAVQHPEAEAAFFERAYEHYRGNAMPTLLREDFAGTAAVAATWVALHDDHRALAVEREQDVAQWASRHAEQTLGKRSEDLHIITADVMQTHGPRVDIVAALNFSVFEYHERKALLAYFRHARRCLRDGGLLIIDAYGGPGAMRPSEQTRRIEPNDLSLEPFDYIWEQRRFDALTHRTDCRIHFRRPAGRELRDAFVYDWRLWTLAELTDLMREARFEHAEVWADAGEGEYRPATRMNNLENWVAYVIGGR